MPTLLPELPDLPAALDALIGQIPRGRVATCGDLAAALGNPVAARWIGYRLLHHDHPAGCPCHRVVRAGGKLGPYIDGGPEAKRRQLVSEGVECLGEALDLGRYGWTDFAGDRPLEALRRIQDALAARVSLRPRRGAPRLLAGVDVAYGPPGWAAGAYALVETAGGRLVWSTTVRQPVAFPYITSYLGFRELPVLLELVEAARRARRLARVVLVDGSGILHPRRAGIACHLGVAAEIATIGVTKKLLFGRADLRGMAPGESRPVLHDETPLGAAIRSTPGSRRPIFVSPGHRLDAAAAERIVRAVLRGRRLPEPLYWADRLARQAALEPQDDRTEGG